MGATIATARQASPGLSALLPLQRPPLALTVSARPAATLQLFKAANLAAFGLVGAGCCRWPADGRQTRRPLKPERFALTLSPCLYLVSFSFFSRQPERWVFRSDFLRRCQRLADTFAPHTAADAERLVSWLNRVDSLRNHRVVEVAQ